MFCAYPPKKDELIEIVDQICIANGIEKGWTSKNPPDKEWLIKVISTFWPTHILWGLFQLVFFFQLRNFDLRRKCVEAYDYAFSSTIELSSKRNFKRAGVGYLPQTKEKDLPQSLLMLLLRTLILAQISKEDQEGNLKLISPLRRTIPCLLNDRE